MKESRRLYLQRWRKKNRARIREKYREYNRLYYRTKRRRALNTNDSSNFVAQCGVGRKYELLALALLPGSKDYNDQTFRGKWDIEWDGCKIDVKMRQKKSDGSYTFSRTKTCSATHFLCFCVSREKTEAIFLFPSSVFRSGLYLNPRTWRRYDAYLVQ